jgi:hypothetical protein
MGLRSAETLDKLLLKERRIKKRGRNRWYPLLDEMVEGDEGFTLSDMRYTKIRHIESGVGGQRRMRTYH